MATENLKYRGKNQCLLFKPVPAFQEVSDSVVDLFSIYRHYIGRNKVKQPDGRISYYCPS